MQTEHEVTLLRDDIDWAYGILLAMREHSGTPDALRLHVEAFIDHYHRSYCGRPCGANEVAS